MLRTVLSLMLSLLLVVTSHSAGYARGAERAVDQMVICVGVQSVVVYVDTEGQPTSAPHFCPDCALHALAVPAQFSMVPSAITLSPAALAWDVELAHEQARRTTRQARAPPILI